MVPSQNAGMRSMSVWFGSQPGFVSSRFAGAGSWGLVVAGLCWGLAIGCGRTEPELSSSGGSFDDRLAQSTEIHHWVENEDSAASPSRSAAIPDSFFADRELSELDEEKLAALQTQYSADVAGVTYKSSPSEVSEAFVRLLHAEDLLIAERLLTLAARAVIHESGLELGPIAGPRAQYVIGQARYATSSQNLAYVDCHVYDPDLTDLEEGNLAGQRAEQGDAAEECEYTVTWVLKPESVYGWRICGMVSLEADGPPSLVNFENPRHAQAINQMYLENETWDETRQAAEGLPTTTR